LIKKYSAKYGRTNIDLVLPDTAQVLLPPILRKRPSDIEKSLGDALETTDFKLEDYLRNANDLLMVIPDQTRRCGLEKFLPVILNKIHKIGMSKEQISFLVATGTHKYYGLENYIGIVGEEVIKSYKFYEHDCDESNVSVGWTSRGTPVEIDRRIWEADKIIAIGGTLPHYFAAYGGGPKLIIPGCAGRKCIEYNHALDFWRHPQWCNRAVADTLENNILIQDIIEAVSKLKPIYLVGTILGEGEIPYRFLAGEVINTYKKLAQIAGELFSIKRGNLADVVIVSTGGHPKDIDLMQSHKSMYHTAFALKPGGTMIVIAECSREVGSPPLAKLIESGSLSNAVEILKQGYLLNGQAGLSLFKMGEIFQVKMVTKLDNKWLNLLKFEVIEQSNLNNFLNTSFPASGKTYYFPYGSLSWFRKT
jgi:nickel-dependent lactate racemase